MGLNSYGLQRCLARQAYFLYAGHAPVLGGESPLRGREPPPLSNGKGVSAKRGLKEAGATATP
jgi:hypothetical protein